MKSCAKEQGLGIVLVAAAVGLLAVAGGSAADDDAKAKEVRAAVLKMAEAMEKNDAAEAKKQTAILHKHELLPIMKQMKLRDHGGIGVGEPGKSNPDGIEAKLRNLVLNRPPLTADQLAKEGSAVARAAYIMAAIAEVAKDRCPVKKKMGIRTRRSGRAGPRT